MKQPVYLINTTNWDKFKKNLDEINYDNILKCQDVEEINAFVTTDLLKAAQGSIPLKKTIS